MVEIIAFFLLSKFLFFTKILGKEVNFFKKGQKENSIIKIILFFILSSLFVVNLNCNSENNPLNILISPSTNTPKFSWINSLSNNAIDGQTNVGVSLDNIYTLGVYLDSLNFEGHNIYSNLFFHNFLISKGKNNWIKDLGGVNFTIKDIYVNQFEIYLIGYYRDKLTIDNYNLNSGNVSLLIIKIYSDGNIAWIKQIQSNSNSYGATITGDLLGNIYFAGEFNGEINIDGITLNSQGGFNSFIAKMNTNGNVEWAKSFSGTGDVFISRIKGSIDVNSFYVTGRFNGNINFDNDHNLTSKTQSDIYIAKISNLGKIIWMKNIEGNGYGMDIASEFGNCFLVGTFDDNLIIDTLNVKALTQRSIFVVSFDDYGNFQMMKNLEGSDGSNLRAVMNGSGNVYIIGTSLSPLNLGNSSLDTGNGGIFILNIKPSLKFTVDWAKSISTQNRVLGTDIKVFGYSNIYVSGYIQEDINIDSIPVKWGFFFGYLKDKN